MSHVMTKYVTYYYVHDELWLYRSSELKALPIFVVSIHKKKTGKLPVFFNKPHQYQKRSLTIAFSINPHSIL